MGKPQKPEILVRVFSPESDALDGFGLAKPSLGNDEIGIPFGQVGPDLTEAKAR
jgi:hypothetical protein